MVQTIKFSEKSQLNSLSVNKSRASAGVVSFVYDLIPSKYISVLVTEVGLMQSSAVSGVIREFQYSVKNIKYWEAD